MTAETDPPQKPRLWLRVWPWVLLLLMTTPAIWHDVSFPNDVDAELPNVVRPTFSAHPPPAYRLAEPGDTIDRVAIYISSLAIVLATSGLLASRSRRPLWLAAIALVAASFWLAANPGPTFDGWHGLGWSVIGDSTAPVALRLALVAGACALVGLFAWGVGLSTSGWARLWAEARHRRVAWLLGVAGLLVLWRLTAIPDFEPFGYWPRWAFVWALVIFCAVLVRVFPWKLGRPRAALFATFGSMAAWFGLVAGGVWLTWYHRPLERLRAIVPGRIYISAMPTARGLEIAQNRHHFKTIINLFPEDTPFRSPHLNDEIAFARANGLNYLRSPADAASSNDFLDETLALAKDPSAWPILIHCHGCMDRTPAWAGIYMFVVEGKPLIDALRFIEGHRGYRPKATVTLLYNRVLPRLAPERCRLDPTVALLARCAAGTTDPYEKELNAELEANRAARAAALDGWAPTLPTLTPGPRTLK